MVALTSAVCVWWKLRSGESTTPPQRGCLLIGSTAASERATTCNWNGLNMLGQPKARMAALGTMILPLASVCIKLRRDKGREGCSHRGTMDVGS